MKKVLKVILAFVLSITIGFTGFTLGRNSQGQSESKVTGDESAYIDNINYLKAIIDQNYLFDYKDEDLVNGSYKGMFEALGDPYTVYYNPEEFNKLMEDTSGEYAGIGVMISASPEGLIKVIKVFDNSPAKEAGIQENDYITKVKDKEYQATDIDKAVSQIKGKEGTSVDITLLRVDDNGDKKEREIKVNRENIRVETVKSQMIDGEDDLGYIQISEFDEVTTEDFENALDDLTEKGAKGIVIDLRNNPGGLLDTCLDITDLFLDEGIIVSTKDKNGKEVKEESDAEMNNVGLTVLINENSASASEIMSGALKDRKRAKIIGTTSFGKGIVQKLFPISTDGSGVKITVSEYFTPNGTKIHEKGVKPDIEVESKISSADIGIDNLENDNQLQKAIEVLKEE
ncbi:MAG: S41 family peptidase [Tissierellia bacterium]|nr:S41 family peptidase [Tissierellia bacterium]